MRRNLRWSLVASALMLALPLVAAIAVPSYVEAYVMNGYSMNGNQELLVDDQSGLIFFSNPADHYVWIWDGSSDPVQISVGNEPRSLDLNENGSLLYVACTADEAIYVIEVQSASVLRVISLPFMPLSVRDGGPNILYVSDAWQYYVHKVDESSGWPIESVSSYGYKVLDMSPDGNSMIAVGKSSDPTTVMLFNTTNNGFNVTAEDHGDLTGLGFFRQMVVDWDGGRAYLAYTYGMEMLELPTLERIASVPINDETGGIALIKDMGILVTDSYAYDGPYLTFFNLTGTNLGTVPSGVYPGPMVAAPDSMSVLIGAPFPAIVPLYATLSPGSPEPGSVYGYTPSFIEVQLNPSYDNPSFPVDIDMMVNQSPVQGLESGEVANLLRGYLDHPLPDGAYDVNCTLSWDTFTVYSNWSFTIDRSSDSAIRPDIISISPEDGASLTTQPSYIEAQVYLPYPHPINYSIEMRLDGELLSASETYVDFYQAECPQLAFGVHNSSVTIHWETSESTRSWSFIYAKLPSLHSFYPGSSSLLTEEPTFIEAEADMGVPQVTYESSTVNIDGVGFPGSLTQQGRIRAEIDSQLSDGVHYITVTMVTSDGTYSTSWTFQLDRPAQLLPMTVHNDSRGYSVPLPDGWTKQFNASLGGQTYDVIVNGPISDGIVANIMIQSGNDPTLREDQTYLDNTIDDIIQGLSDQGLSTSMIEGPSYIQVSNHTAAVFAIHYDSQPIIQKVAIILDAEHSRYWLMIFTTGESDYGDLDLTYNSMISGFHVLSEPSLGRSETVLIIAVLAIAIVAIVVALLFVQKRRRRAP